MGRVQSGDSTNYSRHKHCQESYFVATGLSQIQWGAQSICRDHKGEVRPASIPRHRSGINSQNKNIQFIEDAILGFTPLSEDEESEKKSSYTYMVRRY